MTCCYMPVTCYIFHICYGKREWIFWFSPLIITPYIILCLLCVIRNYKCYCLQSKIHLTSQLNIVTTINFENSYMGPRFLGFIVRLLLYCIFTKFGIFVWLFFLSIELRTLLNKASKEKECEKLARWKSSCVRHLYWSVKSTTPKMREVILAKFGSFLHHVLNIHDGIPNNIFNKCAHAAIATPRLWLTKGTTCITGKNMYHSNIP